MIKNDQERLLSLVATLYYVDNQSQKDVAELAGVSQAKVSRLLAEARKKGIVRISVGPFEPRAKSLEDALKEKLGLHDAVIVSCNTADSNNVRTMGYFAAPVISKLVKPDYVVCVSAGRQLAQLVKEMKPLSIPGVSIVQTMGGIGANLNEYDSIDIGRKLAELWGGRLYTLQTPAIAASIEEKNVFSQHKQIQALLEKMDNADLGIIGVGVPTNSLFVDRDLIKNEDMNNLKKLGAVGEICGRFYDANGVECETDYKNLVIGMTLEQLKATPEVVAVTSGPERAHAILAAVKGGIVKTLITNEETARAIIDLID